MRPTPPTALVLIGLDARHRLGFWTKPMGKRGAGRPALHDALRVTPGAGNPPDPLRWTLHLLWFAVLHSAELPAPVGPGRRDFASPTAKSEGLGPSCPTAPGWCPAGDFLAAPPGHPFSAVWTAERMTATLPLAP